MVVYNYIIITQQFMTRRLGSQYLLIPRNQNSTNTIKLFHKILFFKCKKRRTLKKTKCSARLKSTAQSFQLIFNSRKMTKKKRCVFKFKFAFEFVFSAFCRVRRTQTRRSNVQSATGTISTSRHQKPILGRNIPKIYFQERAALTRARKR